MAGVQGIVRPGLQEGLPSREGMAQHEAGRAVTAALLRQGSLAAGKQPLLEAVERVSIVPRGRWANSPPAPHPVAASGSHGSGPCCNAMRSCMKARTLLEAGAAAGLMLHSRFAPRPTS